MGGASIKITIDMKSKVEMFFVAQKESYHIAVSNIMYRQKKAILCIASKKPIISSSIIEDFIDVLEMEAVQVEFQEITLEDYGRLLQIASWSGYVGNDIDIY